MFASFKKLFRKDTDAVLATSIPETSTDNVQAQWPAVSNHPVPMAFPTETPVWQPTVASALHIGEMISLPLNSVLSRLPHSLAPVVQSQGSGFISFSSKRILEELPKGSVKISFGELRQAAPPETFMDTARHDLMLVELPLNEILMRLNPALLARRTNQKQIHVPAEVTDVFGPRGQKIVICPPSAFAPKPTIQPAALEIKPEVFTPVASPSPIVIEAPKDPLFVVLPAAPSAHPCGETIDVAFSQLYAAWPEMVRNEIAHLNLGGASVALPMDKIEASLKTGKIIFTLKQIGEWLRPQVMPASPVEDMPVELPLSVIAPLFLAKHRRATLQKTVSIGDLPDLFSGRKTTPPAAIPQEEKLSLLPTPQAPLHMLTPEPLVMTKQNALGELFGAPEKTDWSPVEIVKQVATLPGITGAFVALQDGLLVAAQLPEEFKPETLAAFLPQIFGRMNQYAKELQLGGLTSLTFEIENISWQIVKTNGLYFVLLAKAGHELSREKFHLISTHLSN